METVFKFVLPILMTKGYDLCSTYFSESVVREGEKVYRWHKVFDAINNFLFTHPVASLCFVSTFFFSANAVAARMSYNRAQKYHLLRIEKAEEERLEVDKVVKMIGAIQQQQQQNSKQQHELISNSSSSPPTTSTVAISGATKKSSSDSSEVVISSPTRENYSPKIVTTFEPQQQCSETILESRLLLEQAQQDLKDAIFYTSMSFGLSLAVLSFETYIKLPPTKTTSSPNTALSQPSAVTTTEEQTTSSPDGTNKVVTKITHHSNKEEIGKEHFMKINNDTDEAARVYVYSANDKVPRIFAVSSRSFTVQPNEVKTDRGNWTSGVLDGAQYCVEKIFSNNSSKNNNSDGNWKCQVLSFGDELRLSDLFGK